MFIKQTINKNISQRDKIIFDEEIDWKENKSLPFTIIADKFIDIYRRKFIVVNTMINNVESFLLINRRFKAIGFCNYNFCVLNKIVLDGEYTIDELINFTQFIFNNRNSIISCITQKDYLLFEF
jgi:hypothetical protein